MLSFVFVRIVWVLGAAKFIVYKAIQLHLKEENKGVGVHLHAGRMLSELKAPEAAPCNKMK